jgi:hypothetical protein
VDRRKQREPWASTPPGSLVTTIFVAELTSLSPWNPGGPSSTYPASVVAAAGPATSIPQGARRRRLQHRWWPLPKIPIAAHRGPVIDVSSFGGGCCRMYRQHPLVACHRHLQHRWWPLPEILTAAPRGGAIDVSSFGGGRCRTCHQHPPGGPTVDVFNIGGGHCQKSQQQPPGGPPWTSLASAVTAARPAASTP